MNKYFPIIILTLIFIGCNKEGTFEYIADPIANPTYEGQVATQTDVIEFIFQDPIGSNFEKMNENKKSKLLKAYQDRLEQVNVNGYHFSYGMKTFLITSHANLTSIDVLKSALLVLRKFVDEPEKMSNFSLLEVKELAKHGPSTMLTKSAGNID